MLPFRKSCRRPFTTCPPTSDSVADTKPLPIKKRLICTVAIFLTINSQPMSVSRQEVLFSHSNKKTQGTDMPGQEAHLLQPMGWPFQNAHPTGVFVDSFYFNLPLQLSLSWRICAEKVTSVSTLVKKNKKPTTLLFC